MNYKQIIGEFFQQNPQWAVEANVGLLTTNCPRPMSVAGLQTTAARIRHMLATNPEFVRTFNEFYQENPQWADCEANTDILTRLHRGDPITLESLREVSNSPQCHLTVNAATLESNAAAP